MFGETFSVTTVHIPVPYTDTPCADIDMVERVARLPSGQREVPQGKGKEERARPTRSWLASDWKEVTDATGRDRSTCKCGGNITDRREVEECFGSDLLGSATTLVAHSCNDQLT